MLFPLVYALLALAACADAKKGKKHHRHAHKAHKAHHSPPSAGGSGSGAGYHLSQSLQGQSLFNAFNFVAGQADNGGVAYYNGLSDAWNKGLLSIGGNGQVALKVGTGGYEQNRDALKLVSRQVFNSGLFIFDIASIPSVCGAWPAIWFTGSNWPQDGEIDVVEGVHETTMNAMSTHTGSGCTQQSDGFSGTFMMAASDSRKSNCDAYATNSQGCGVRSSSQTSYGTPFNNQGGGVYALKWDGSGISTYHFARNSIPSDISAGNPNPNAWGTPENHVGPNGCAPNEHFKDLLMVINTNLCGTWPDGTWNQDMSYAGQSGSCAQRTGVSSCEEFVRSHGSAFNAASWKINSIKIYN